MTKLVGAPAVAASCAEIGAPTNPSIFQRFPARTSLELERGGAKLLEAPGVSFVGARACVAL